MPKLARVLAAVVLLAGVSAVIPTLDARAAGGASGGGGAGGGGQTTPGKDTNFNRGELALEDGDWKLAVKYFEKAVQVSPGDPDAFNLLAYSYRRLGKLDPAFANYDTALRLDPEHRGAREYLGEAYLMIGEVEKAEDQLAMIKDICGRCSEAKKLKKAIARFKENEKQATLDEDW
jgi:Flp pilus assembly protein TadD